MSATTPPPPPLLLSGKLFFGSLCVGTFGLGVWQVQRFFEKVELTRQRDYDLQQPPLPLEHSLQPSAEQSTIAAKSNPLSFRLRSVQGYFLHRGEILVGPRGPPPGAVLSSAKSLFPNSGNSGGMAASPQGYYVITPFRNVADQKTVLVNRGWVPRNKVVGHDAKASWDRPVEMVQIIGVVTPAEKPRFLTPQHDFNKKPLQFFWMDLNTMADLFNIPKEDAVLMTQIKFDSDSNEDVKLPIQPPKDSVGDFKTTPLIHAGYATTWFGLSGAGIYMTRMLLRGKGW